MLPNQSRFLLQQINIDTPEEKLISEVVSILQKGGVIIYPTDTVYAMGCDITNKAAIEKVCLIKGIKTSKAQFAFICASLSHLSDYTQNIPNNIFRLMKQVLPGPFTFILKANNHVPKLIRSNKKTIGIRVPDNNIVKAIVEKLGHPIITTSLHSKDDIIEFPTDPVVIAEQYKKRVNLIIDGGYGGNEPSTVIDCTNEEPVITRQGKGIL